MACNLKYLCNGSVHMHIFFMLTVNTLSSRGVHMPSNFTIHYFVGKDNHCECFTLNHRQTKKQQQQNNCFRVGLWTLPVATWSNTVINYWPPSVEDSLST